VGEEPALVGEELAQVGEEAAQVGEEPGKREGAEVLRPGEERRADSKCRPIHGKPTRGGLACKAFEHLLG
jgi:hypothetical protein